MLARKARSLNVRQKRYVVLNPRGKKYHELRDETQTVCGLRIHTLKRIVREPPSDATLCKQCSGAWARSPQPKA